MGNRDKPTAPASPWQNGFAERLIGSIRRECLDHVIVLGEAHLRQILKNYAAYYNSVRIPIYSGRVFRREAGHRSDLKPSTIPK
jgi:transposase InsO family protein